jgi:CRISPR system Cascade subunit CasE
MYLTQFVINHSHIASQWISNPYRVHQRLMMAYENESRLLFRIEITPQRSCILVQSSILPEWHTAFNDLPVLAGEPEYKNLELNVKNGAMLRFRLVANPVVTHNGKRLGLLRENEQFQWLKRKLTEGGAEIFNCTIVCDGFQRSHKGEAKDPREQVHFSVQYDGTLKIVNADQFLQTLKNGIGPAKGYGFGLLSVARFQAI